MPADSQPFDRYREYAEVMPESNAKMIILDLFEYKDRLEAEIATKDAQCVANHKRQKEIQELEVKLENISPPKCNCPRCTGLPEQEYPEDTEV